MALDFAKLLVELRQESDELLGRLARLSAREWEQPTTAQGWDIGDQVSHLAYFDDVAQLALTDPAAFRATADRLTRGGGDIADGVAAQYRSLTATELTDWFAASRAGLLEAFAGDDPRRRLPWFGPDMSVASSATARLMETWAHGQDVYDTIGEVHPPSPGLRSIAHLGVSTFAFAHRLNGYEVPDEPVGVQLCAPDGSDIWTWGPIDARNRVSGPAEDFVLVVTQRRHWTDTALVVDGEMAAAWLDIAQAFAGAPTRTQPGRAGQP